MGHGCHDCGEPNRCICEGSHDALLKAKRRADTELKALRTADSPGFLERHGVNAEQPPPVKNDREPVWSAVVRDMEERNRLGIQRYGTPLQPFNGRDSLVDAYQEALDLVVYLKQRLIEEPWTKVCDGSDYQKIGPGNERWTVTLDRYERNNLMLLLEVCGYYHYNRKREENPSVEPFTLMNTGDWLGQVFWKLQRPEGVEGDDQANVTADEVRQRVGDWLNDNSGDR